MWAIQAYENPAATPRKTIKLLQRSEFCLQTAYGQIIGDRRKDVREQLSTHSEEGMLAKTKPLDVHCVTGVDRHKSTHRSSSEHRGAKRCSEQHAQGVFPL